MFSSSRNNVINQISEVSMEVIKQPQEQQLRTALTLDVLPIESICQIVSHLPVAEIIRLTRTSRGLRRLTLPDSIHVQALWKSKFRQLFPKQFSKVKTNDKVNWFEEFTKVYRNHYIDSFSLLWFKVNDNVSSRMRELFELVKKGDLNGLIKAGVKAKDLGAKDHEDNTLVKIARELGHQHILDYFFQEIVSPVFKDSSRPMTDEYFCWIVCLNQVESMVLIEAGEWQSTAMKMAVRLGIIDIVEWLLNKGINVDFARSATNKTYLYTACENGYEGIVDLLLNAGADPNITLDYPYHQQVPRDQDSSPLCIAAKHGFTNIVISLLDRDANPNQATYNGDTPLHLAASGGWLEVVNVLVEKGKVDVNQTAFYRGYRVFYSSSAIQRAAFRGHFEVVEYLVSKGADLNGFLDDYILEDGFDRAPYNVFRYALKYGRVDIAEQLVATNRLDVDATDIRYAEHFNHEALAVELERQCLTHYVKRLVEEPEKKTILLFNVGLSRNAKLSAAKKRLAQLSGVDVELEQQDIKALTSGELRKIERMNDGNYRFNAANSSITLGTKSRAKKQPT